MNSRLSAVGDGFGRVDSGTVEEIERYVKAKKPVRIYSSGKAVAPSSLDPQQLQKVRDFKEQPGSWGFADDDAECCQIIARTLANLVRKHSVAGIIAELPSAGAKGARAIGCMARAGAVVAVVAESLKLPSEWVTPQAVKKTTQQCRQ